MNCQRDPLRAHAQGDQMRTTPDRLTLPRERLEQLLRALAEATGPGDFLLAELHAALTEALSLVDPGAPAVRLQCAGVYARAVRETP